MITDFFKRAKCYPPPSATSDSICATVEEDIKVLKSVSVDHPQRKFSLTQQSVQTEAIIHELTCYMEISRLIHLGADPQLTTNKDLIELNGIQWRTLTEKDKRKLRKGNEKYLLCLHNVEASADVRDFGHTWWMAFRALRKAEWERLKYIANGV